MAFMSDVDSGLAAVESSALAVERMNGIAHPLKIVVGKRKVQGQQ
jgi:hypothetical protein